MAAATKEQILKLEAAMADQFNLLVQGAAFRIALARDYGLDSEAFKKYNAKYVPLVQSWIKREVKYERELVKKSIYGIIASGDLKAEDFYLSSSLPKLVALVKKWNVEKTIKGMGFIPLLIWGAIAIFGLWTAQEVTDDFTTTTQEKAELLKATQDTALALGLTPEQASGLISQTQKEASEGSGLGDIIKYGLFAVAAIMIIPQITKSTN